MQAVGSLGRAHRHEQLEFQRLLDLAPRHQLPPRPKNGSLAVLDAIAEAELAGDAFARA